MPQQEAVYQAVDIFTDTTGIYRTFEAQEPTSPTLRASRSTIPKNQAERSQASARQIERLREEKPAISMDSTSVERTLRSSAGNQWLATLSTQGELVVCSALDEKFPTDAARYGHCQTCRWCFGAEASPSPNPRSRMRRKAVSPVKLKRMSIS